ncbi:acyltransferase [Curvivirga sp.]|uniref:acyltransferase n=1 Tax=Curvivirga sp. TaxID=2856848 RepID=UPI003B59CE4B
MIHVQSFKQWAKHGDSHAARFIRRLHQFRKSIEIPKSVCGLYRPVYRAHRLVASLYELFIQTTYLTPMFKSQIEGSVKRLNLYGGLPYISGPLKIKCGDDCRISGATTFSGRTKSNPAPELIIGHNVGIGWQTTIAVGTRVVLSDNVRMGGRNFLAGYPGHPVNADERARGLSDYDDQAGDIILEKDVWLGTGVMVMAGVTIGEGTIVAAGSIVTKSLPANVLAGGSPAKVIKPLMSENPEPEILEFKK